MSDSLREMLAEQVREPAPAEPVEVETAPEVSANDNVEVAANDNAEQAKIARDRDERGRFAAKAKEAREALAAEVKPPKAKEAPLVEAKAEVLPQEASAPPQETPAEPLKAPQSWKVDAREMWGQLSPRVQQEVLRREKEIATALKDAGESQKSWAQFQQIVAPYSGMMQAEGAAPLQAVQNLLQTAAALRTAPPQHKAQLVAGLVRQFGIPIDLLDSALAGQPSPQQGQEAAPTAPYRDPRVDQLMATLQQAQQQRAVAMQQKNRAEIEQFKASREFFEDVREDMADIIDARNRRGISLSLEDAYNLAVSMHPEISAVLKQREAAKANTSAQTGVQRSKAAASSVKSTPAGNVSNSEPTDLRGLIAAQLRGAG